MKSFLTRWLVTTIAILLWFTSRIVPEFHVAGFWSALFGSLVISLISIALNALVRHEGRIRVISKSNTFRRQKVIDI